MREWWEDILDQFTVFCGLSIPARPPKAQRLAYRLLGSSSFFLHSWAEDELLSDPEHSAPLLHKASTEYSHPIRAVHAALLLHILDANSGDYFLKQMLNSSSMRCGPASELLRRVAARLVNRDTYVDQMNSSLTLLEQFPDSSGSLARFQQAAQILIFLGDSIPSEILQRSLFVRAVGGENLSLVRSVIEDSAGVDVEHVSQIRKITAEILHLNNSPDTEFSLLYRALTHPNPAIQLSAIGGFVLHPDSRAIPSLYALAQNPVSPVREDARSLLLQMETEGSEPYVLLRPQPNQNELLMRPVNERVLKKSAIQLLRVVSPNVDNPGGSD